MPEMIDANDFALRGLRPVRASKGERTSFLPSAHPILRRLPNVNIAVGAVHA